VRKGKSQKNSILEESVFERSVPFQTLGIYERNTIFKQIQVFRKFLIAKWARSRRKP
jgi:hypothetical protein